MAVECAIAARKASPISKTSPNEGINAAVHVCFYYWAKLHFLLLCMAMCYNSVHANHSDINSNVLLCTY